MIDTATLARPPALKSGDRLAAVSLSWAGPSSFPRRYQAGVRQLEAAFDVTVVPMPNALADADYIASHPEARADDLHQAFADDSLAGIISTIGGDDSIRILPFLDMGVIGTNPKVLLGFSDTTVTHMACLRAGLVTFYGPAIMTGFAENGGIFPYAKAGIRKVLFEPQPELTWEENKQGWTVELLDWANPANQDLRRSLEPCTGWRWMGGQERAEGPLVVGCLEVLDWLRGTQWWPDLDGAILALETSEEQPSPDVVRRFLRSLAASGDLDRLSAVLFGRPGGSNLNPADHGAYDDAVVSVLVHEQGCNIPIVAGMDFGHTDPSWTLPIGVLVKVDPVKELVSVGPGVGAWTNP